MNSGTRFGISSIFACLLFVSAFSILLLHAPPTVVANGAAKSYYANGAAKSYYVIVRGDNLRYSAEYTDGSAWENYQPGDCPPLMVAQEVGAGRVVASGLVATCRSNWFTPENNFDNLLDYAFKWMRPGLLENRDNVLWYGESKDNFEVPEWSIYQDAARCKPVLDELRGMGYKIDNTVDNAVTPLTSELVAPYDILVIPQFELGAMGTGGDPDLLPDSYITVIKNFVEGGGGLLIMDGGDFSGYCYQYVQNRILDELGIGMHFQSDTIEPNSTGKFNAVVTDNLFGENYKAEIGTTVMVYSACSMAEPADTVEVSPFPASRSGSPGGNLTYTVTIKNKGRNPHTYSLESTIDNGNWEVSINPTSVSVPVGENRTATLTITIPSGAENGAYTWATVTANDTENGITGSARAGAEVPTGKPQLRNWITASKVYPGLSPTENYGIYVEGAGENVYITYSRQFFRYNTAAGWWEALPTPMQFMNGCCLCWDRGNSLYALAGASYTMVTDPARRVYTFYRYDIPTNSWTKLANTPWYQGAGDALTLVETGGKKYLYAILGTTSPVGGDRRFWRYDIADDEWDMELQNIPYGADDGANLAWTSPKYPDYIYAFPGAYEESLDPADERHFMRYTISTDSWADMENTPDNPTGGVDDGGSLVYPGSGGYIYALKGGSGNGDTPPGDNFWRYSIPNNSWETLADLPNDVLDANGHRLGVAHGSTCIYCWRGCKSDGTLWVYMPDLKGVEVSISPPSQDNIPGGTLKYTVTVKNTGNIQENYILTRGDSTGWGLENLILDNYWLLIPKDENRTTKLTVTIPGGTTPGTHDNVTVTATSQADNTVSYNASCTAHAISENRGVAVSISPPYQSILVGENFTFTVKVTNTGSVSDNYNLTKGDNAGWTLNIQSTIGPISPGASQDVTLTVTIPATAENNARDNVRVKATSQTDNTVENEDSCIAHAVGVLGRVEVSIDPTSKSGAPSEKLNFTVTVTNLGSAADTFTVEVTDTENWALTVSPTSFSLNAGGSRNVGLTVTIPSTAADGDSTTITVTATGTGYDNYASCTATAVAGGTSPFVYVGAVVVIVGIIAALLIFIKPF